MLRIILCASVLLALGFGDSSNAQFQPAPGGGSSQMGGGPQTGTALQSSGSMIPGQPASATFSLTPPPAPKPPTDEDFNRMVANCPLFKPKELADDYAKSRKEMQQQCPGVVSLEQEVFQLQSKYQQYLSNQQMQQESQQMAALEPPGAPASPLTTTMSGTDKLTEIQNNANSILQSLQSVKCAKGKTAADFLAASLPVLSMITPPGAYAVGSGAQLAKALTVLFQSHHLDQTGKFALCASSKLMQQARSQACQVTAFDAKFTFYQTKPGDTPQYSNFNDRDEKLRRSVRYTIDQGSKTKTFKILNDYDSLKKTINGLNENAPVDASAKSALQNAREIKSNLCPANSNSSSNTQLTDMCTALDIVITHLTSAPMTSTDPDSGPVKSQIDHLKVAIQRLSFLDLPSNLIGPMPSPPNDLTDSKAVADYQIQLARMPTLVAGENFQQTIQGMVAYHLQKTDDKTVQDALSVFKVPRDTSVVKDLLNQAIDNLPENLPDHDVNANMCKVTSCLWDNATTDLFFKDGDLKSHESWDFQDAQSMASIKEASGLSGQSLLEKTKRYQTLKNIIDKCSPTHTAAPSCNLTCSPLKFLGMQPEAAGAPPKGMGMGFGMPAPPPSSDSPTSPDPNRRQ